jgi:acyl-CoA synthetase (AMP-forming)/AMP-acid ligase II
VTQQSETLLDLLAAGEKEHPALVAPGRPDLNYKQLRRNVESLAAQLNQFGLGRGDRVAIAMPNGPEMVLTFFGVALGCTAAPLNPKYKQEEFAFYFEDTQAKALITLPGTLELAHAAASPEMAIISAVANPDGSLAFELVKGQRTPRPTELAQTNDVAMILHTSGTTSRPKRVPIRHRNLVASATNIKGTYLLGPGDRSLCVMPLFHIHGIVASMLSTLASGGTVIAPPNGFNALEFWSLVETYKPTWYSAVPTMHQMLLARADRNMEVINANPFRFIRSSSASLPPVIMERMEEVFKAPVLESYGMTEATHQMASNPLPPKPHKAGTVGYGHGVKVALMDEVGNLLPQGEIGEVVIQGRNVVDGYENNPEANAKAFTNGWFRTGDQGRIDPDGYLSLTGRLKELINRGGEKISPLEIDDVLLRHPAVAEAMAFAVPHKSLGEDIHAAVVLKDPVAESELRSYCTGLLAEFKVPRKFHILQEIPRGATGKLQRINMAQLLKIKES